MSIRLLDGGVGNPGVEGDTEAPLAPVGVTVGSETVDGFTVSWTANGEPDIQDYRVYVSSVGPSSGFALAGSAIYPATSYAVTGLSEGAQYWTYVTARDNAGNESLASSVVSTTTDVTGTTYAVFPQAEVQANGLEPIFFNDTNISNQSARYRILSENPLDGSFEYFDGGAFRYTAGTQLGTAGFTYQILDADGLGTTFEATVTVTVSTTIPTTQQSSVTQEGVTWTFDQAYPVGQFVSGDYFVVSPTGITLTGTTPAASSGRNGTMINPGADIADAHGFDNRIQSSTYSDALNFGLSLGAVAAGSSICTVVSGSTYGEYAGVGSGTYVPAEQVSNTGARGYLEEFRVLTVLDSAPPLGSFRPGYVGTDRTIDPLWVESNINYNAFGSLVPASGFADNAQALADHATLYSNVQVEIENGYRGRFFHPTKQQYSYGGDLSVQTAVACLLLQCNFSNAEKRDLAIGIIQYGIDNYVRIQAGGNWGADGGHNLGRKCPTLIAGAVLGDNNILATMPGSSFQEDVQHFYVASADLGTGGYGYASAQLGLAEWCSKTNRKDPGWTAANTIWDGTSVWADLGTKPSSYRYINYKSTGGYALVAHIMGLTSEWGDPAFIDYHDRVKDPSSEAWSGKSGGGGFDPDFTNNMWDTYRGNY